MDAKHTPGPWKWWTSNGLRRLTAEGGRDGGVLSAVRLKDGFADIEVSEEDARLIEAAPKMLEACVRARRGFNLLIAANDITDDEREQVALLDAAIAQATGT